MFSFPLQHFTAEYLAVVWRSLHRDLCMSEDRRGIGVYCTKLVLTIFEKNGLVLLVVNIEVKTMEQITCGLSLSSNEHK